MTATAPTIVSRAQWGADPLVTPAGTISTPTAELWLHHSAGEQFDEAGMRMLQSFTLHRPDAHYVDLEYTFVVDHRDCRIFESRGVGRNSAATGGRVRVLGLPFGKPHNDVSHAICVMGNFQNDPASDQLIATLANLVAWGYEQAWWPLGFTGGHRDASGNSTACPGDHLEARIAEINARAASIHAGGPAPTPAPSPSPTLEEPMLVASKQTNADGTFRGARWDPSSRTLIPLGGAAIVPNPSEVLNGWEPLGAVDVADDIDGVARVQVVNANLRHETFRIK